MMIYHSAGHIDDASALLMQRLYLCNTVSAPPVAWPASLVRNERVGAWTSLFIP
jgi:hypothetical protein